VPKQLAFRVTFVGVSCYVMFQASFARLLGLSADSIDKSS